MRSPATGCRAKRWCAQNGDEDESDHGSLLRKIVRLLIHIVGSLHNFRVCFVSALGGDEINDSSTTLTFDCSIYPCCSVPRLRCRRSADNGVTRGIGGT